MTDAFHLKIISPAATMLSAHVAMAEVPGSEGDFGVLDNHAPFFSMLRPGVIRVHYHDGVVREFFAASGYADVSAEGCTILSDHIQDLSEISPADASEALKAAQEAFAGAETDAERRAAEKLRSAAEALVHALAA